MVPPSQMCNEHLLGEHLELHMFVGTISRGKNIHGYIVNNLVEPNSIVSRHDEIVKEMTRRGMKHKSQIEFECPTTMAGIRIDKNLSSKILFERCKNCGVEVKQ